MARRTEFDHVALERALQGQDRVLSLRQALACGMTDGMVVHKTRLGGPWQRLLPGVYLTVTGTPTTVQREIAALLYAGRGSVITGVAALRRHGVRPASSESLTVLIPHDRRRQSTGFVRVLRTQRMPEHVCIDGAVQFAMAARAVADAARELTNLRDVRAVVADAVQKRRCPLDRLAEELQQGPVRYSARLRLVLGEVRDGIRSAAEGDLRELIQRAGLPKPMFNARLYAGQTLIAVADAWWPDAGVAAEVDSREWHLSPEDWEQTLRRNTEMSAHGIVVLRFTPRQIRDEPAMVVAGIRAAIEAGRNRGLPAVQAREATA
jgi:very-short-patch-repair endonuclease